MSEPANVEIATSFGRVDRRVRAGFANCVGHPRCSLVEMVGLLFQVRVASCAPHLLARAAWLVPRSWDAGTLADLAAGTWGRVDQDEGSESGGAVG